MEKVTHSGHRQRLYKKYENDETLEQHELLELMLFALYPRSNTNPIAHNLIKAFNDIPSVLCAPVEDLARVEGMGEQAAYYLHNLVTIMPYNQKPIRKRLKSHREVMQLPLKYVIGLNSRILIVYYFNDKYRMVAHTLIDGDDINSFPHANKISEAIELFGAKYIFVAHSYGNYNLNATSFDEECIHKLRGSMLLTTGIKLLNYCLYDIEGNSNSLFSDSDIQICIEDNQDFSSHVLHTLTRSFERDFDKYETVDLLLESQDD